MSSSSLDLSTNSDLEWIADVARSVLEAAQGKRIFIVGAMARELVLVHGYGIHPGRATRDLDFAVRVGGWEEYESIQAHLIEDAGFVRTANMAHRLQSPEGMIVDLLPFGAVESRQRTIAWPPDGSEIMTMIGFAEIADAAIDVTLSRNTRIDVAGPAGQALLKLVAWSERSSMPSGSDAYDLTLLLRNYLEAGNDDRLYEEAADLLDVPAFDREVAGATLLGRDIAALVDLDVMAVIRAVLEPEIDPDGALRLAGDLDCEIERALRLLQGLHEGLRMNTLK